MTTTDREKSARQWAENYQNKWQELAPEIQSAELVKRAKAAADHVLATTAPATMADVDWDAEKHHLAGAVFQNVDTTADVVMFRKDGSGAIIAVDAEDGRPFIGDASKYTPNGKRYELREITEPGHPEALETLEDYENAPEGTIVALPDGSPWVKNGEIWKSLQYRVDSVELAGIPRDVLRWGPGDEA